MTDPYTASRAVGCESTAECKDGLRVRMSENVIPEAATCWSLPEGRHEAEIAVTWAVGTPGWN